MPVYSRKSETERLAQAELALNNAKNDADMLAALTPFGYDTAKLDAGLALHAAARQAVLDQDRERGEQFAATDALDTLRDATYDTYMQHVKLARVALADDRGAQADLGLLGPRERDLEGWIEQARNFYASIAAKPALLATLQTVGLTDVALNAASGEVEGVEAARRTAREEREEAQSATFAKDQAVRALDVYMGAFLKVGRVVFEDQPQRLERLGIVVE